MVVFALIAAQAGVAAHFALVRHGYCAEHGELIELSAQQGRPDAPRLQRGPGLVASNGVDEEHAHEHCVLSGHKRDALVTEPALLAQLAELPPSLGLQLVEWSQDSGALYLVAPKQSPPVV